MKKKITPDIDMQIIAALSTSLTNKEIALMYGVSPSYVSKLKTGKKVPYIHIAEPSLIKDEFFEIYNADMVDILMYLEGKELFVSKQELIEYLTVQMKKSIIQAKMYQNILRRIKNE